MYENSLYVFLQPQNSQTGEKVNVLLIFSLEKQGRQ